jgi:hypothetical protein
MQGKLGEKTHKIFIQKFLGIAKIIIYFFQKKKRRKEQPFSIERQNVAIISFSHLVQGNFDCPTVLTPYQVAMTLGHLLPPQVLG